VTWDARFIRVAHALAARSIAVCPLRLDDEGIAKVPLVKDYPRLTPEDNSSHDWRTAAGLGIVLGSTSGNLAVVDVDDAGLSEYLARRLLDSPTPPLMVSTKRRRLHVYCVEPVASLPIDLEVQYQGRRCLVQLLAAACQVAAPPTPGYDWYDAEAEPFYGTLGAVWNRMAKDCGLHYRAATPFSFLRRERSRGPTTAQIREASGW